MLSVTKQKSFVGGIPTDNIIAVLDAEEEVTESKLRDINEAEEPDKDILNVDTDDDTNLLDRDSDNVPDYYDDEVNISEDDDGMDSGIPISQDP